MLPGLSCRIRQRWKAEGQRSLMSGRARSLTVFMVVLSGPAEGQCSVVSDRRLYTLRRPRRHDSAAERTRADVQKQGNTDNGRGAVWIHASDKRWAWFLCALLRFVIEAWSSLRVTKRLHCGHILIVTRGSGTSVGYTYTRIWWPATFLDVFRVVVFRFAYVEKYLFRDSIIASYVRFCTARSNTFEEG